MNSKTMMCIILMGVILCGCVGSVDYGVHKELVDRNNENIQKLLTGKELPVITEALDRDNLIRKYEFLDQRGSIGWIYIITSEGVLLAEEPVLNKLTNTNTYLTPMEEIDRSRANSDDSYTYFTYEMSDIDATYGENVNGVFWFDPDGVFQEIPLTGTTILYSSERKTYNTPPILESSFNLNKLSEGTGD